MGLGFSVCLSGVTESKTYYVGIAGDNEYRLVLDGVTIVDSTLLVNEVALLRNKFLGISKGFEAKNFMTGHIIKLRVAGLDDASI